MFESTSRLLSLGAAAAFLLALAHECVFLFVLGIDVRAIPFQIGDIVTLSALMLPSILALQIGIFLAEMSLGPLIPKFVLYLSFLAITRIFSFGYYGQVGILVLFTLLLIIAALRPSVLEDIHYSINRGLLSFSLFTVSIVIMHAFSDAGKAMESSNFATIEKPGEAGEFLFVIRSIGNGFLVRDTKGQFRFLASGSVQSVTVTRLDEKKLKPMRPHSEMVG